MPSHKTHKRLDKLVFGKSFPKLHKIIDGPFKVLGPKHRQYFHDPLSAMIISRMVTGSPLPGILHILADKTFKEPRRR